MSIRLLYLTREPFPSFRPDIATLFGKTLPEMGVHADLVALHGNETEAVWPGGRIFVRRALSRWGRLWARQRVAFDLFRLAGSGDYDAIQVRDRIVGALIGLAAARWHRLPFFYWMSLPFPEAWLDLGSGQEVSSGSRWRRLAWRLRGRIATWLLYGIVLPRADHIFAQSDAMRDMLAQHGLDFSRITPVPMGVALPEDPEKVVPADDSRLTGRQVVAYLGALERIRRPEIMLEALAKVVRQIPDVMLVLIGDSQTAGERQWLESEIDRLGLRQHAFITGWLPPQQAWRYLRAARIGLSPFPRSRVLEVASPTKVCEYLAYGLPVVANDQPDQAYLIRETEGGLCVPLTADGFAEAILRLLAAPDEAKRMAEKGRGAIARLRAYDVIGRELAMRYRQLFARTDAR